MAEHPGAEHHGAEHHGAEHDGGGRRLALVVLRFPSVSETFVVQRVLGLLDRGWDVHVVCNESPDDQWAAFPELVGREGIRDRVHVVKRPVSRLNIVARAVASVARSPISAIAYLARARPRYGRMTLRRFIDDAVLSRIAPDVVHFEFGQLLVGREWCGELVGCAVVVSFQGYDLNYLGLRQDPGFYAEVWARADAFHFVSNDLARRAKRRGLADDSRAFVVLNGVAQRFLEAEMKQPDPSTDRPLHLVSVGRLHWKKGLEFALMAVKRLVDDGIDVRYRIVGDGELYEALLYAVDDLGLRDVVTLCGPVPHHEIAAHLVWADVLLHPATSEGFCLAVAEAQAIGLPVVTSDADGLAENVADGETGFVVARRDVAAFVDRLTILAKDPGLRERMGRAGRRRVETSFTLAAHLDGMERVFDAALRQRTRAR